jgi:Na+/melibiose symporter-like transporter
MMVGLKGGLSIGSALVAWILGLYNYVPKAESQVDSAIHGTKMLISIFPAIPFLIGFGLLFYYEIDKKMELKIEKELKERRTT